MPREYMSCLGRQCVMDDNDSDGGYYRLDNTNSEADNVSLTGRRERTQNDYFRPPNAYQWSAADNDQGQEPSETVDQGSHNYSGVQVQSKHDKKKPIKKSLPKRIRHFLRVSFKWMRRGFVAVSPAVTPQLIMNPAIIMSTTTMGRQIQTSKKPLVFL